jgi:hypothetical protein
VRDQLRAAERRRRRALEALAGDDLERALEAAPQRGAGVVGFVVGVAAAAAWLVACSR